MKKVVIISVSVLCVVLVGLAVAGGPMGGLCHRSPEERVDFMISKISDKLELSADQKVSLERIADETKAQLQPMRENCQTFKADFLETLRKEEVSAEELKALLDTKKPAIEDMMQLVAQNIAEIHGLLTPEQRETLINEIESHKGRRCKFTQ